MFCRPVLGVLLAMAMVSQCDAQCCMSCRARRPCRPVHCCVPHGRYLTVRAPCCGSQVTWTAFGYRPSCACGRLNGWGPLQRVRVVGATPHAPHEAPSPRDVHTPAVEPKVALPQEPVTPDEPEVPAEKSEPGEAGSPGNVAPEQPQLPDSGADEASVGQMEAKATPEAESSGPASLVATARSLEKLSVLLAAAARVNLLDEVTDGPFTIFAPTDAAFAKLDESVTKKLKDDDAFLSDVLRHHAVAEALSAEKLVAQKTVAPVSGPDLQIKKTDEGVFVNGAHIQTADIKCTNGVIHVIDEVLLPSTPAPRDEPRQTP